MKPDARDGFVLFGITCGTVGLAFWFNPWASLVGIGAAFVYMAVNVGRAG